ncbi:hypothetical protein TYRP_013255 [Tyrophagus putrescentiae]|nr:hypothetical protein TYRP_013255 [Tyrophagus putrescentiae]
MTVKCRSRKQSNHLQVDRQVAATTTTNGKHFSNFGSGHHPGGALKATDFHNDILITYHGHSREKLRAYFYDFSQILCPSNSSWIDIATLSGSLATVRQEYR